MQQEYRTAIVHVSPAMTATVQQPKHEHVTHIHATYLSGPTGQLGEVAQEHAELVKWYPPYVNIPIFQSTHRPAHVRASVQHRTVPEYQQSDAYATHMVVD